MQALTRPEIDARFQAKQRLDRPDAILAPGLINTHTHAAMSLFRGIADDLKLSASTVGTHLYNIKQKLAVVNQSELTLIAIRHGLIEA